MAVIKIEADDRQDLIDILCNLGLIELPEGATMPKAIMPTPDPSMPSISPTYKMSPQGVVEMLKFIRSNQKIMAIKAFRGMTGEGLKESKEWVDNLDTFLDQPKRFGP